MRTEAVVAEEALPPDAGKPAASMSRHVVYYLGSKIVAAVLNLTTLALFVRLGGTETYGAYVLQLAWAGIVYGLSMQWLRFAFLTCYREDIAAGLITAYLRTLVCAILLLGAVLGVLASAGIVRGEHALGVLLLVAGLSVYDALHEMSRTRLKAQTVAAGVLLRAVLMLVLGITAIELFGTPLSLSIAVALAHLAAAAPMALELGPLLRVTWSPTAAATLWKSSRTLFPAFAFDGAGAQLDRVLISRLGSLGTVGSYGAVADLIRQFNIVLSEAISGAYAPVARAELKAGRSARAGEVLGQAFLANVALVSFGGFMVLRFERLIVETLFGQAVATAVAPLVLGIVIANALMVLRSYHFSQALYIIGDLRLLTWSNGLHCLVLVLAGLALAPFLGLAGIVWGLCLGHFSACLVLMYALRGTFALQLPLGKAAVIVGVGLAAFITTGYLEDSVTSALLGAGINLMIFAICALILARCYNLLSFNDLIRDLRLALSRLSGARA